ncbi:hypothetical protein C9374_003406 [Naegleria lovaniensis]|uniref:EF-hand domain-containing protein n=1 Tax=Naegleria lovaniensis TaxID=51637 RepID=A0AA88GNW5_NAELO|nr:uncharacterized protein C9374_003406 [Naegleria lovaniensis]KAG2385591.1 hypothetical protein C9374_003406 [Naegleria lovaniensis]
MLQPTPTSTPSASPAPSSIEEKDAKIPSNAGLPPSNNAKVTFTEKQLEEYREAFDMFVNQDIAKQEQEDSKFRSFKRVDSFMDRKQSSFIIKQSELKSDSRQTDNDNEYDEFGDLISSDSDPQEEEDNEPSINLAKLGSIMRSLFQNPTETELKDMIKEVDADGNGEIEFDEFLLLMASKANELDSFEEMKEAFNLFDKDKDGIITVGEVQKVFAHIGCDLTLDECDLMIKEVDQTGKGIGIEFEDFVKLMKMSKEELNESVKHIIEYDNCLEDLRELQKVFHEANTDEQKLINQEILQLQDELILKKQLRDKQVYKGKHTRKMLASCLY